MFRTAWMSLAALLTVWALCAEPANRAIRQFRDCAQCPVMRLLPAGDLQMGSPPLEDGRREDEQLHHVRLHAFAIGRDDVTRAQFLAFVGATHYQSSAPGCFGEQRPGWGQSAGRTWNDPGFAQTPNDPVVCVTWTDARAYAAWLSTRTGRHYRLPTESEWEYAARAGTVTARYWGIQASHEFANYGQESCCGGLIMGRDRWLHTSPVESFPPNAFGLYDMAGNVGQWVEDCRGAAGDSAPADGTAFEAEPCAERMRRGGGWIEQSRNLRAAWRFSIDPEHSSSDNGFRVAMTP